MIVDLSFISGEGSDLEVDFNLLNAGESFELQMLTDGKPLFPDGFCRIIGEKRPMRRLEAIPQTRRFSGLALFVGLAAFAIVTAVTFASNQSVGVVLIFVGIAIVGNILSRLGGLLFDKFQEWASRRLPGSSEQEL